MTQSDMNIDGDFDEIREAHDENPKYSESLNHLMSKSADKLFLLTVNEDLIEFTDDSYESDEVHEMIHRSNTKTKMLY